MFVFVAFLLFSGAFSGAAYYIWVVPQQEAARALDARLRSVRSSTRGPGERGAHDLMRRAQRRGAFAFLGDFVEWLGVVRRLQVFIQQANLTYRAADVVGVCMVIALIAYVVLDFLIPVFLLRLAGSLAIGALPIGWVVRKRTSRLAQFEAQLPDAIDLFTRTMRAGHNIHSGLETIAAETADPVRMEFRKMVEELALGSQIEPALHNLGERIPIIDLKFFITGLILQRQTGANMVAVLENLAVLVRERLNMAAKLKAHTAQQRYSAALLCGLPFVVGVGFWLIKPDYLRLLWTDPTGTKFFIYGIVSECVGIVVIRRMANVKF
jgi:tight adherence protein B